MVLFTSVYLANLLCSFYNCQYLRPPPTTSSDNSTVDRFGRSFETPPDPVVNTTLGLVEGYFMTALTRKIYAFEGIPYAEPPVGNLRFRDPVPKRSWNGVRNAKKPTECLQFNLQRYLRVVGNEACLDLNVYTPAIPSDEYEPKLPILIFIHGGSFIIGRGHDYGPAYLLQENIILVTINYRLGVLGFLSTGDEESSGNFGLKDQALAIKFIFENAERFGGDRSRISISGQSAGAASAHLQMLSTSSVARGYFRNVISLSGSAAQHWSLQTTQKARQLSQSFAKRLNCPVDDGSKAMVDCLKKIEGNFLVAGQNNLIEFLGFPLVLFSPVIEPNVTGAFITESVESAYENGHVAKLPFLCTSTAEEGEFVVMAMKNLLVLGHTIRNWDSRAPLVLDLKDYPSPSEIAREIRDTYFRNVPPRQRIAVTDSNVKLYGRIGTDRYFTIGNRRTLKYHGAIAPTYSYIFRYKSRFGVASFLAADYKDWGSAHGEDLTIIFNNTAFSDPMNTQEKTYEVSRKVMSLIANFVSENVPYLTAANGSHVKIWDTIGDPEYPQMLEINGDGDLKMIDDPFHGTEELNVWARFGIK